MNKVIAYARLLHIQGIGRLTIPPAIGAISVVVLDFYSMLIVFIVEGKLFRYRM